MTKRPLRSRLAKLTSLMLGITTLVAIPMAAPESASATVAIGDLVYVESTSGYYSLMLRKGSTGTSTTLLETNNALPLDPEVSPNGAQILYTNWAFDSNQHGGQGIWVMNSDGSGSSQLTFPDVSQAMTDPAWFYDFRPRWSPDGTKVVFSRKTYMATTNSYIQHIYTMDINGTNLTDVTPNDQFNDFPTWSPDGTKIAFLHYDPNTGSQVRIIDANGTNGHAASNTATCDNFGLDWSPTMSRIYFWQTCSGNAKLSYFDSTDNFASSSNTSEQLLIDKGYSAVNSLRVSGDGSTVYYDGTGIDLYSVGTSTGVETQLTTDNGSYSAPTPVKAAYPIAPPSNSTVALSAPSSSDAPYTRKITIGLSSNGNQRFEYGWSTSSSTAPNTAYLQTTSDMTNRKGILNYLGKYAGSGTTWNGGTQPNADWYLWVRSVTTGGTANAWGTPLKVRTPKKPVWVSVGDSYTSGHHQDVDEPLCPQAGDLGGWPSTAPPCSDPNAPYVTPNDYNFAWPVYAGSNYNVATKAPAAWQITVQNVALSGAPASSFGQNGTTVGSALWASGNTQAAKMANALYSRYDSWNIVSMTGGANDTGWAQKLTDWYIAHAGGSYGPWAVPSNMGTSDCPDSQALYTSLTTGTPTLNALIKTYLQGIVTAATSYSPGVRILSVGYPDVVNTGNICYNDSGTWHGFHSVIGQLNANHSTLSGSNVKYVDLTASTAFGTSPVADGLIQTSRLYGYPHPGTTGQTKIAQATAAKANAASTW